MRRSFDKLGTPAAAGAAAARDEAVADLPQTDAPQKAKGKAHKRRDRKPRKSTKVDK
jgi:hypothetical protein